MKPLKNLKHIDFNFNLEEKLALDKKTRENLLDTTFTIKNILNEKDFIQKEIEQNKIYNKGE